MRVPVSRRFRGGDVASPSQTPVVCARSPPLRLEPSIYPLPEKHLREKRTRVGDHFDVAALRQHPIPAASLQHLLHPGKLLRPGGPVLHVNPCIASSRRRPANIVAETHQRRDVHTYRHHRVGCNNVRFGLFRVGFAATITSGEDEKGSCCQGNKSAQGLHSFSMCVCRLDHRLLWATGGTLHLHRRHTGTSISHGRAWVPISAQPAVSTRRTPRWNRTTVCIL